MTEPTNDPMRGRIPDDAGGMDPALRAAWHGVDPPPVPDGWQPALMAEIRRRASEAPAGRRVPTVEAIVWRGAAAAALVALLAIAALLVLDLDLFAELARLVADDAQSILQLVLLF